MPLLFSWEQVYSVLFQVLKKNYVAPLVIAKYRLTPWYKSLKIYFILFSIFEITDSKHFKK